MTSELGVERRARQRHLFDCSCGSTIETTGRTGTCWNCGERIQVCRVVATATGKKYEIRIRKHRRTLSTEPLLSPRPFSVNTTVHQPKHRNHPDNNDRFTLLGLKILLAPLYVPLLVLFVSLVFAPPAVHQDRLIVEPEPTDCGLFSGCHYVQHTRYEKGYTIVTWERVTD